MTLFQQELDAARINLDKKLIYDVVALMKKSNLKLGVAESITSGAFSSYITEIPYGRDVFVGGVVYNQPSSFVNLSEISPKIVAKNKGLDPELSIEAAKKIKSALKTDIGLAILGLQGIKEDAAKAEYTSHIVIGCVLFDKEHTKIINITGNLDYIKKQSVQTAIIFLKQWLINRELSPEEAQAITG